MTQLRTNMVNVRMTDAEVKALKRVAKKMRRTQSDALRELVRAADTKTRSR